MRQLKYNMRMCTITTTHTSTMSYATTTTTKALIEPHHIMSVSFDISVLIIGFGYRTRACKVDIYPMSQQNELDALQQKCLG